VVPDPVVPDPVVPDPVVPDPVVPDPVVPDPVVPDPVVPDPVVPDPVVPDPILPNLSGYSSVLIYKNVSQTLADVLLGSYSNLGGFEFQNASANCTDFGFTTPTSISVAGGIATKTYSEINMTTYAVRACAEADYANAEYGSGSASVLAYYGN